MKLKKLEKLRKNKKKALLGTLVILCSLGIGLLLGKTFSMYQVNKSFEFVNGKVNYYGHSDVYFAFYNGSTWLEDIPQKGNADGLVFDYAKCDNNAKVEWDSNDWAPKIINLTKAKTKCSLYFKVDLKSKFCKSDYDESLGCAVASLVREDNTELIIDETADKNIRYIGNNPRNIVKISSLLGQETYWRIIGIMNNVKVSGSSSNKSLIKLIAPDENGEYNWNQNTDWTDSDIYNSYSFSFASENIVSSYNFIEKDVIWNFGVDSDFSSGTANDFYDNESFSKLSSNYANGIGLMSVSDYGFAVGKNVRGICLETELDSYNISSCATNNWLYVGLDEFPPSQWTFTGDGNGYMYRVKEDGSVGVYYDYSLSSTASPVIYIKADTILSAESGNGSSNSPFIIDVDRYVN